MRVRLHVAIVDDRTQEVPFVLLGTSRGAVIAQIRDCYPDEDLAHPGGPSGEHDAFIEAVRERIAGLYFDTTELTVDAKGRSTGLA